MTPIRSSATYQGRRFRRLEHALRGWQPQDPVSGLTLWPHLASPRRRAAFLNRRSGSWPISHGKCGGSENQKFEKIDAMAKVEQLAQQEPSNYGSTRRECHNEQLQSIHQHFWIGYHNLRGRLGRASALCGCSRFSGNCHVPGLDYSLHLSRPSCPRPLTARIRHVD